MNKIGIVGSINTDFVSFADKMPKPGETVNGRSFSINYGGKGANVAVSAARLNGKSKIFACVGDDNFSKAALENLRNQNVDVSNVKSVKGEFCGSAQITVTPETNSIVVCSGANGKFNREYIEELENEITKMSIVATQLEIPVDTVLSLSRICRKHNVKFLFNPSPIKCVPKEIYENSDYILVNEVEIKQLEGYDDNKPFELLKMYNGKLILTKGKEGVYFYDGEIKNIPSIDVTPIDTTGAGDTFTGAFLTAIVKGYSLNRSLIFANTAAGLKTTKKGAQTGMPYIGEVEKYLSENKC